MQEYATLIRRDEAMELVEQFKDDLVMNQLLNYANYVIIGGFQTDTPEALPVADFDLFFYLKTVERFCQDQDFLKTVLAKMEETAKNHPQFSDKEGQIHRMAFLINYAIEPKQKNESFFNRPNSIISTFHKLFLQQTGEFVRGQEALQLLNSVEDPTTRSLMLYVTHHLLMHTRYSRNLPVKPFDLYFFMRAMKTYCSDHLFLNKVLDGEDLRWFSVA